VPGGYLIELRLPRSLVGPRLGFTIVNVDDPAIGSPVTSIGTSDTSSKKNLGAVIVPSPEVTELVRRLGRARSRIWVLDVNRRVIAQAGTLRAPPAQVDPDDSTFLRFWEAAADILVRPILRLAMSEPHEDFQDIPPGTYRLEGREIDEALAGQTGTRRRLTPDSRAVVLSAAQPVWLEDKVVGAVLIEETTNDVLALRNRAFEKLFAALLVVYVGGTAALLVVGLLFLVPSGLCTGILGGGALIEAFLHPENAGAKRNIRSTPTAGCWAASAVRMPETNSATCRAASPTSCAGCSSTTATSRRWPDACRTNCAHRSRWSGLRSTI